MVILFRTFKERNLGEPDEAIIWCEISGEISLIYKI
jgi:hypothetical protein